MPPTPPTSRVGPFDAPILAQPPVQACHGQEWYYCRSAWHVINLWIRLMFCQMYPPSHYPICPLNAPGRGIWWPRVVLTWVALTWAYVLLSAIDHLEFSRVLCNRVSEFHIFNPSVPPIPPSVPLTSHPPQYRHVMVRSGTTAGQHDMSSTCGSGWCFVRCTPHPITPYAPSMPQVEASGGQGWY